MIEWTVAARFAASGGAKAYEYRHKIQHIWTHIKVWAGVGSTNIAVTGHPGAGKTILSNQLYGYARHLGFKLPEQSEKEEVESFDATSWARIMTVVPGQEASRVKAIRDIFVENNSLEGVIHVVDYGFSLPRNTTQSYINIKNDGIDNIDKLRSKNLSVELRNLDILLSDIERSYQKNKTPKWVIIAVNKIDLYKNNLDEALSYYHPEGNSEFSKRIKEFQYRIGSENIRFYVIKACAWEVDFEWNNEIIESNLEKREQLSIIEDFSSSLVSISERG